MGLNLPAGIINCAWALLCTANSEGAPLSPPLQLSGLFQLDDSYETCSSKPVLETGESIQGKEEVGDEDM